MFGYIDTEISFQIPEFRVSYICYYYDARRPGSEERRSRRLQLMARRHEEYTKNSTETRRIALTRRIVLRHKEYHWHGKHNTSVRPLITIGIMADESSQTKLNESASKEHLMLETICIYEYYYNSRPRSQSSPRALPKTQIFSQGRSGHKTSDRKKIRVVIVSYHYEYNYSRDTRVSILYSNSVTQHTMLSCWTNQSVRLIRLTKPQISSWAILVLVA
jgi:hypothetical protein